MQKKAPTNPTKAIRKTDLDQMLIKWISHFSNTGWRTDNCFAGFHLACSRLAVVGGEGGKKGGAIGGERNRRASEEKMGGDCLSSWGRAKKAGERGKKGGDSLGSWGQANLKNQHAINFS